MTIDMPNEYNFAISFERVLLLMPLLYFYGFYGNYSYMFMQRAKFYNEVK